MSIANKYNPDPPVDGIYYGFSPMSIYTIIVMEPKIFGSIRLMASYL